MKIHLLMHLDGGNRGCEAITKSTAILLNEPAANIVAYTTNEKLDTFLGLKKYCTLISAKIVFFYRVIRKILLLVVKEQSLRMQIAYHSFLRYMKTIQPGEIYLSTGGDMMCYGDNETVYSNNYLCKKGVKTILWGCSMGKENLSPVKLGTLKKFSAIYARESLSYGFFKDLGLNNVFLLPDPAFILKPQPCDLPSMFKDGDVVGINLSNYILKDNTLESNKAKQVLELINHILENTKYHILLIPHVFWKGQNDIVVCNMVKAKLSNNPRISILNSELLSYCEIRYVISKCKFFVGARTHSVISAYSMCIPTIALGYSIKARGIAKDIGMPENLVVDFREHLKDSVLLDAFLYLETNENQIRNLLQTNIPPYVMQLEKFDFREILENNL
jgi:polysaccharide pyruvyl transferase WcaK-like protein